MHSAVTRPVTGSGLLIPAAEGLGFRLNTVLQDPSWLFADISWQPPAQPCRFHPGLCRFPAEGLEEGEWHETETIGVCQLLAKELRLLVPGGPAGRVWKT